MSKELGIVKVQHDSGMVETDKGIRSMITAKVGDRLIMDERTKVVSIKEKKTDGPAIKKDDYAELNIDELKAKFNLKELKAIAKLEKYKGYSSLKEDELAELIAEPFLNSQQDIDGSDDDIKTGTDDAAGDE